jgi:hypothetical protein
MLVLFSLLLGPGAWAETVNYSDANDAELQALGNHWEELSRDERRALLTEFHRRMIAAGRKPVLRIRTERRFGYRVEQPDGSVVKIERRQGFVRYRELDPDQPFGVGFEQRSGHPSSRPASTDAFEGQGNAVERLPETPAGPVPRASQVPVYQLPVREVQVGESRN